MSIKKLSAWCTPTLPSRKYPKVLIPSFNPTFSRFKSSPTFLICVIFQSFLSKAIYTSLSLVICQHRAKLSPKSILPFHSPVRNPKLSLKWSPIFESFPSSLLEMLFLVWVTMIMSTRFRVYFSTPSRRLENQHSLYHSRVHACDIHLNL